MMSSAGDVRGKGEGGGGILEAWGRPEEGSPRRGAGGNGGRASALAERGEKGTVGGRGCGEKTEVREASAGRSSAGLEAA